MIIKEIIEKSCIEFDLRAKWDDVEDLYKNGPKPGISLGWPGFDEFFKMYKGQLNILTGTPSSGKSEWIETVSMNLAVKYDWNIYVYTPENFPVEHYVMKLSEKLIKKPFFNRNYINKMSEDDIKYAYDFICNHYTVVDCSERAYDIDNLLFTIEFEQKRRSEAKKIDMVIIDPWNELDSKRPFGVSETDFTGKCLSECRRLARRLNVSFWIVAHPQKLQRKKDGTYPTPTLYDISGSAHWRNKADNGIILHREEEEIRQGLLYVKAIVSKIKNRFYGKPGEHYFNFDLTNSTYSDADNPNIKVGF
jgi:twinkle protein